MPRAAMSVAIRTGTEPLLKSANARSRWPWLLLPWIAFGRQAGRSQMLNNPVRTMLRACKHQRPAHVGAAKHAREHGPLLRLVDEHHTLFDPLGRRRDGRHGNADRIASAAVPPSPAISFGIVAEKNRVCRCAGNSRAIRLIGITNPRSSMWSASSSTRTSVRSRRTWPSLNRSSRRPGVATITSTPPATAEICLPFGTPPKISACAGRSAGHRS